MYLPFVAFRGWSSSRLTLSRELDDSRWEVKRGDFGCWVLFSTGSSGTITGTGGRSAEVSAALPVLLIEEDLRLVRDLVLGAGDMTDSTSAVVVVSLASSNVSYRRRNNCQRWGLG